MKQISKLSKRICSTLGAWIVIISVLMLVAPEKPTGSGYLYNSTLFLVIAAIVGLSFVVYSATENNEEKVSDE
jgi:uncharacterized membrane protein YkgB